MSALFCFQKPGISAPLRAQDQDFFLCAFHIHAVRFHIRIVAQGVVDDAAVKGVERFQLHGIAPAEDFLGGFLRLFYEHLARLCAVAAHIKHHLRCSLIRLKQDAVH